MKTKKSRPPTKGQGQPNQLLGECSMANGCLASLPGSTAAKSGERGAE